jgi:cytochrome c
MRRMLIGAIVVWVGIGVSCAQQGKAVDLKAAPADHQVEAVGYCEGRYEVKLKDGLVRQFREFDLSFKTDSGPNGPKSGAPALVLAGRVGDRAFLIFSGLEEMKTFLQRTC